MTTWTKQASNPVSFSKEAKHQATFAKEVKNTIKTIFLLLEDGAFLLHQDSKKVVLDFGWIKEAK